jgi:hypothetical protein
MSGWRPAALKINDIFNGIEIRQLAKWRWPAAINRNENNANINGENGVISCGQLSGRVAALAQRAGRRAGRVAWQNNGEYQRQ